MRPSASRVRSTIGCRVASAASRSAGFTIWTRAKFNQRNFVVDLLDNTVDARTNQPVKQTQVYNGVDMTMNWRFGTGGLVSGGGSIGRTVTDNCFTIDSPQQERDGFCHVSPTWGQASQVKFMVVYPLFDEISASAIYQNSSGSGHLDVDCQ